MHIRVDYTVLKMYKLILYNKQRQSFSFFCLLNLDNANKEGLKVILGSGCDFTE